MLDLEAEQFDNDDFESVLANNNAIQIILRKRDLCVECERRILSEHNLTLSILFKNGIKSDLVNLNNHFKV